MRAVAPATGCVQSYMSIQRCRKRHERHRLTAMEAWPFDTITPQDWEALTPEEKAMLEALTAAYLAEIERRQHLPAAQPDPSR